MMELVGEAKFVNLSKAQMHASFWGDEKGSTLRAISIDNQDGLSCTVILEGDKMETLVSSHEDEGSV